MRLLGLLAQVSTLRLAITILLSLLSGAAELGTTICVLEFVPDRHGAMVAIRPGRHIRGADRALFPGVGGAARRAVDRAHASPVVRSVLHLPLLDFERIGATRLTVAFTGDVGSVGSAVRNLAALAASSAILVACLAYIGGLRGRSWSSRPCCASCASAARFFCAGSKTASATLAARPGIGSFASTP